MRELAGGPRSMECAFCGDMWILDPLARSQLRRKYCSKTCTRQASRDQRRAKLAGVEVERIDRHAVFERDGYVCGICEEPVDRHLEYPHPMSASLDHVIPIIAGGSHTYGNVQCSHRDCNVKASTKGWILARSA
jgi:5-methylcytosine-specific restriction endonuclease McrA